MIYHSISGKLEYSIFSTTHVLVINKINYNRGNIMLALKDVLVRNPGNNYRYTSFQHLVSVTLQELAMDYLDPVLVYHDTVNHYYRIPKDTTSRQKVGVFIPELEDTTLTYINNDETLDHVTYNDIPNPELVRAEDGLVISQEFTSKDPVKFCKRNLVVNDGVINYLEPKEGKVISKNALPTIHQSTIRSTGLLEFPVDFTVHPLNASNLHEQEQLYGRLGFTCDNNNGKFFLVFMGILIPLNDRFKHHGDSLFTLTLSELPYVSWMEEMYLKVTGKEFGDIVDTIKDDFIKSLFDLDSTFMLELESSRLLTRRIEVDLTSGQSVVGEEHDFPIINVNGILIPYILITSRNGNIITPNDRRAISSESVSKDFNDNPFVMKGHPTLISCFLTILS